MSDPYQPDVGPGPQPLPPAPGQVGARQGRDVTGGRPEPFIPSRNDRPYSQWGTPDFALAGAMKYPGVSPGPFMPQMNDFPGLIHGVVMALGRFGSRYSGMPAIAMGTYATAFWSAYQKGMKERASENWQQYQRARQMTIDRQDEENRAYAEVYAAYRDENGNITDTEAYSQALLRVASKYHDQTITNAVMAGQLGMVDRILGAKDKAVQDLQKAVHQEQRQRLQDENLRLEIEERKKRLQGGGEDPGWEPVPPSSTTPDTSTPDTSTPDRTKPDTGADTGGDTTTADDGDEAKPSTSAPKAAPSTTRQGQPVTPAQRIPATTDPRIAAAASDIVRGVEPKYLPKNEQSRASAEAERRKALLNDETNRGFDPNDEKGDLARIAKIDPNVARDIEAMGHYRRTVPSGGASMYSNMENLVRAVYPHWDPGVYKYIDEFRGPNGKMQTTLLRAGNIAGAAEAVFRGLQDIDEKSPPPKNWIEDVANRNFTGMDNKWSFLGQAVYDYISESLAVQQGGARPQVTQIEREMKAFPVTIGAKGIRALMTATAIATAHRIDEAADQWKSVTFNNEVPGYNEKSVGWIKAIGNLNYNTGYERDNRVSVPESMKPYLGPAGKNIKSQSQPETRQYQGKTYRLKPGADRSKQENWEVVQ